MMKSICALIAGIAVFLLVTANAAAQTSGQTVRPEELRKPWAGMKKLLVVADVRRGYQHDSINHAMAMIEQLGRDSGKWATVIRTDSQLITKEELKGQGSRYSGRNINAHNLNFFDGIFILSSGAGTLDDEQKQALLSFIRDDGKGIILGHAAAVAYYNWPEYFEMIGGFMEGEYWIDTLSLTRQSTFPGATAFPEHFTYKDQFPIMASSFTSDDAQVILSLDPSSMSDKELAKRGDHFFPVTWAKYYGNGRVFFQGIGHIEKVWDDPKFQKLMTKGIKWALGITDYELSYPDADADRTIHVRQ